MYKITKTKHLTENIIWLDVFAPQIAKTALPGQFLISRVKENSERIPLTVCDYDRDAGTVTLVIQAIGNSTGEYMSLKEGDFLQDLMGPLGKESLFLSIPTDKLKAKKILFVAGGLGTAPVFPQVKWLHSNGVFADVLIGAKTAQLIVLEKEIAELSKNVYIATDDGSKGFKGNVAAMLEHLITNEGKLYDEIIAIGPVIMMKFVCLTTKKFNIPTTVSMNTIMVDGTGMCGACRLTVGDSVKFTCVDGPEFDGHKVNFDEALRRLDIYRKQGKEALDSITESPVCAKQCPEYVFEKLNRVVMPIQKVSARVANFEEVALGYSQNQAIQEASRCLECKKPVCVDKCPVGIDIPGFIGKIKEQDFEEAVKILNRDNSLPSICGRVCPQESQCEGVCIVGKQGESVAIGRLERFVGDWALNHPVSLAVSPSVSNNSAKIAVIGSGPAGLACAADLAKMGHNVTIFEALHEPGGVLIYGIPEFRLPKEKILAKEIENIKKLGVKIQTNTLVGRTVTIDNLLKEEGFSAVFLGTGAGLPKFMNIPNENANGVFSANEYLTRANLMRASKKDHNTPIVIGEKVCVIGGGNVAMDAARTALRLGSKVYIVYRRGMDELPARLEEVHHAKEEGVVFKTLTNPTEILVKETGWVSGIKCTKMKLGDMDSSGRPSPVPVEGSDFVIDCDIVIMALGTSPNPIFSLGATGLTFNKGSRVIAEESTGQTCNPAIFAGGDIVTGAATVIMAMGAGRTAATAIDKFVKNTQK